MGTSDLDLEALWDASPDGPPAGVPPELWPMVRQGRPHAGIFRGPAGDLVVVCALEAPSIGRYAEGEVVIQRGAERAGEPPRILLTFLPACAVAEGQAPLRPFGICFELHDRDQRQLWREFIAQPGAVVSYLDVSEGVLVARRNLGLEAVASQIGQVLDRAEATGAPPR